MAKLMNAPLWRRFAVILRGDAAIFIGLGLLTAILAWPAIFSTLALYDDEGYVMMTLQTYMHGHRLYGETHTQYGPAFYFLTAPIHSWLEWPLTQSGVRIKTLIFWGVAVVLCYSIVRRASNSKAAGVATGLLAILHLDKLSLEPGHPQEVALIGTLLMFMLVSRSKYIASNEIPSFFSMSSWFVAGFLAGVIGLVKLNCGVVIAIPLLLTAALQSSAIRRWGWGLIPIAIVSPLAVAWTARSHPMISLWALWLGSCSLLLLLAAIRRRDSLYDSSISSLSSTILGGVLSVALILGLSIGQGVSLAELWQGIVGQHSHFADYFFVPFGLTHSAIAGMIVAAAALLLRSSSRYKELAKPALWIWVGLSIALTAYLPLQHGLNPRGAGLLLTWAAPGWIVWQWRDDVAHSPKKLFLGLVAILSPLIAFPVSGTQVQIGSLPSIIVLGILLGEFLVEQAKYSTFEWHSFTASDWVTRRLILSSAVSVVVLAAVVHWIRYTAGQPLNLPGSTWMRLPVAMATEQRSIVDAIQRSGASTLFFEGNNHNRFYFWTGLKPLTAANPTFWPLMLIDQEERQLGEAIDRQSKLCVVRVPQYDWLYHDHATEIRERIEARWQPSESVGDWEIGVVH